MPALPRDLAVVTEKGKLTVHSSVLSNIPKVQPKLDAPQGVNIRTTQPEEEIEVLIPAAARVNLQLRRGRRAHFRKSRTV